MCIFAKSRNDNKKSTIMKRIYTILATMAIVLFIGSCEKSVNSDKDSNSTKEYEIIEINNFNQCFASNFGCYYSNQPEDIDNWYIELAVPTYDLENLEGNGYNLALDTFSDSSNGMTIQEGTYKVKTFKEKEFANFSLLYGGTNEDEDLFGTWVWDGNEVIAGITDGEVTIKKNKNGIYQITFNLIDSEWKLIIKGSYNGHVSVYDERDFVSESYSLSSTALKSSVRHKDINRRQERRKSQL